MATDLLQYILVDILRLSDRVISTYSSTPNPVLDQVLYLVFFPTIFIILAIFFITRGITGEHKALRILLSIAFYIFVISYPPGAETSLYNIVAQVGNLWYILIIILGFLWAVFSKLKPWGDKAPSGPLPGRDVGSSIGQQIRDRARFAATGQEKRLRRDIERAIKELHDLLREGKSNPDSGAWRLIPTVEQRLYALKDELSKMTQVGGIKIADTTKLDREIDEALAEIRKHSPK